LIVNFKAASYTICMQKTSWQYVSVIIFLVLGFIFSNSIVAIAATKKETKAAVYTPESSQIVMIQNSIKEHTPSMIATPILKSVETLENFREKIRLASKTHKEKAQLDVKKLSTDNEKEGSKPDTNYIKKSALYVEIFFLFVVNLIFTYLLIFYGLFLVIVFYIIRYIFRLFF
jgi:hypothetical protein